MKESFTKRFSNWFAFLLIILISIGGTVLVWPTFCRNRSLKRQEIELVERIERKKAEIAELVENQRRFRCDPDFVERIARQNRRVFPGELVFVFDKAD